MRILIKLFSVLLLIFSVFSVFSGVVNATAQRNGGSLTFLVVGFDKSPANTDVLCVVSYDSDGDTVRAVQIPRDTCINYGEKNGKINGFYSYNVNKGKTHEESLNLLSDCISQLLGVKIDGYAAVTTDGFVDLVDYIGGININYTDLPQSFREKTEEKNGTVHLDGNSALEFVRYRKDYVRGDIDRLDAQKIFAKAIFTELKEKREFFSLLKFLSNSNGISLSIEHGGSVAFMIKNIFKASNADFQIATLPGNAQKSEGVWYYIVKREEAESLIKGYFPYSYRDFDTKNFFVYEL